MKQIYLLSGLGVDHRVYENIHFGNLIIHHIAWIPPLKNESIEKYAFRLSEKIVSENSILIGLSFGGMIAIEIAKIKKIDKIILIASAKKSDELPFMFSFLGKLKLDKILPSSLIKTPNSITNWYFGIQTKKEKKLLRNILKDTDPIFLKWAINKILNWRNNEIPPNIIHIHGDKDRIIPIKNIKTDYIIANGGHFMTLNKAVEIEKILLNLISK